jgi:hypothetical protein
MDDTTSTQKSTTTTTSSGGSGAGHAYGTAKTESLRDNGLWRILVPGFILLASLILLAFPLIILIPLFLHSLDPHAAANRLGRPEIWIWIVMFVIEIGIIAIIVSGLAKAFLDQARNYRP